MKRIWVGMTIVLILLSGCKKQSNIKTEDTTSLRIELKESFENISTEKTQVWHNGNDKIIVLFGYGFNDENFVTAAKKVLSENFGLFENGGKISPVVFPNDFRHKDKAVTSDFFNILNEEDDISGIVLLGAPENTHRALAKMQDLWEGELPYPIFSLFPQDDVLGTEDTSDIVIDRIQKAEMVENLSEESEDFVSDDASEILTEVISYMLASENGFPKDEQIGTHAFQMLRGKKLRRYADAETGLFALNHFVIEE